MAGGCPATDAKHARARLTEYRGHTWPTSLASLIFIDKVKEPNSTIMAFVSSTIGARRQGCAWDEALVVKDTCFTELSRCHHYEM